MESLVGLRAEVQRKRQELLERATAAVQHPTQRLKIKKGDTVAAGTECSVIGTPNRGVAERDAHDKELAEEEKYTADKARCVLEQKAALYDRLHGGVAVLENETLNNTFLVNFQKKIVDNVLESQRKQSNKKTASGGKGGKTEDGNDEWVEYVDAFGRTREVRQSEVAALKKQDKNIREEEAEENNEETLATAGQGSDETVAAQQEQFEEQFREQQRRRWEQQEELNAMKKDVHYQDVMFDEARTHGAAFVRLSGDTETRREQQTLLRELHASSEAAATQHRAQQRSRDKTMAHRLDKIRQRKRLKLGLPMTKGSFDKLKTPPPSDDEEEEKETNKDVACEHSVDIPAKRPDAKLREWDVGKQIIGKFVEPSDKDPDAFLLKNPLGGPMELSQEAWLDRQRRQRNDDFAPPSEYQNSASRRSSNKNKSSGRFGHDRKREGSPSSSSRFGDEDRLQKQYNNEARGNGSTYISNECGEGYKETTSSNLSSEFDQTPNRFITKSTRPGAAIPPPTSFEYYGPPDKKRPRGPLFDPMKKMEEAISKGLKQLKNLT